MEINIGNLTANVSLLAEFCDTLLRETLVNETGVELLEAGQEESCPNAEKWYCREYEYNYLQAMICIHYIILGMVFEFVYERISGLVEKSYKHRVYNVPKECKKEEKADERAIEEEAEETQDINDLLALWLRSPLEILMGEEENISHVRLFEELMKRGAKEFMILGFLGFSIFCFNQAGGFNALARWSAKQIGKDQWPLPFTPEAWIETAEQVHVQLFLAAICYFIVLSTVVRGTMQRIRVWENLRLRHSAATRMHAMTAATNPLESTLASQLEFTNVYRDYFIKSISNWQHLRPETWNQLLQHLFPYNTSQVAALSAHRQKEAFLQQVNEGFDGNGLAFNAYLALNLEAGVRDSIEIQTITWFTMLVVLLIFAFFHRVVRVEVQFIGPFIIVGAGLMLLIMWAVNRSMMKSIQKFVNKPADNVTSGLTKTHESLDASGNHLKPEKKSFHERHETHLIALRFLQVMVFLISLVFTQTVADKNKWTEDTWRNTTWNLVLYVVILVLIMIIAPINVPRFLAMMSMPPCIDEKNLTFLYYVIRVQLETSFVKIKALTASLGPESPAGARHPMSTQELKLELICAEQHSIIQALEQRLKELEHCKVQSNSSLDVRPNLDCTLLPNAVPDEGDHVGEDKA